LEALPVRNSIFSIVTWAVLSLALQISVMVSAGVTANAQTVSLLGIDIDDNSCYARSYPAVLAQGRDGNLYSSASICDTNTQGAVFSISPLGGADFLYHFDGVHGSTSNSGLTLGTDGNFYGTTTEGGADNFGTIFKVTSGGSLTTLYSFTNGTDGATPYAPPIEGVDGNFYGTTSAGTAYKITSAGIFTSLGAIPGISYAPLFLGADGNFYGTTTNGGKNGLGTVFEMAPRGTVSIVYSFDGAHGSDPIAAVIQATDGNFYGTTVGGGSLGFGVVFKLTPASSITVLHNFNGNILADGYMVTAALVQATDGSFYGAASAGGGEQDGLLFKVSSAGAYEVIFTFCCAENDPMSSLMQHTNGQVYGITGEDIVYGLDVGLPPFIKTLPASGKVGKTLGILGEGFTGATSVKFNGRAAAFTVVSDTYISTSVPAGATSGFVTVVTPVGTLTSNAIFRVSPEILSFSPTNGPVGTSVVIKGESFTGATEVVFACGKKASFVVNSETEITATVPAGAMNGAINISTPGGAVASTASFTVTP
jgi:uncharacterized repeat protein (TIGR03803 family)